MNDTIKTVTEAERQAVDAAMDAGFAELATGEIGIARYAAYARAHGRTPEAMLEHDRAEFPGGCMAGFIVWLAKQKAAFFRESPGIFVDRGMIGDQAAWTAFLERDGGTRA